MSPLSLNPLSEGAYGNPRGKGKRKKMKQQKTEATTSNEFEKSLGESRRSMLTGARIDTSTYGFGASIGGARNVLHSGGQTGLLAAGSSRNHQRRLPPKSNTGDVVKSRPMNISRH